MRIGEINHWLTQHFLLERIFHKVRLVDDVHQLPGFDHTPKFPTHSNSQFEVFLPPDVIQFANVEMGAFGIGGVYPYKWKKSEKTAIVELMEIFWLRRQGICVVFLSGMDGIIWE
jgi:hypothetical protein